MKIDKTFIGVNNEKYISIKLTKKNQNPQVIGKNLCATKFFPLPLFR